MTCKLRIGRSNGDRSAGSVRYFNKQPVHGDHRERSTCGGVNASCASSRAQGVRREAPAAKKNWSGEASAHDQLRRHDVARGQALQDSPSDMPLQVRRVVELVVVGILDRIRVSSEDTFRYSALAHVPVRYRSNFRLQPRAPYSRACQV